MIWLASRASLIRLARAGPMGVSGPTGLREGHLFFLFPVILFSYYSFGKCGKWEMWVRRRVGGGWRSRREIDTQLRVVRGRGGRRLAAHGQSRELTCVRVGWLPERERDMALHGWRVGVETGLSLRGNESGNKCVKESRRRRRWKKGAFTCAMCEPGDIFG